MTFLTDLCRSHSIRTVKTIAKVWWKFFPTHGSAQDLQNVWLLQLSDLEFLKAEMNSKDAIRIFGENF